MFHLKNGDVTASGAEAVVNAANTSLSPGGGVCGAIFRAAGYDDLKRACASLGSINTGEAVITDGFKLAKKIIHTAGPIYSGSENDEKLLRSAYRSALKLAKENGLHSIAFPLISAGIYGYPYDEALRIAKEELSAFSRENPQIDVSLYLYP